MLLHCSRALSCLWWEPWLLKDSGDDRTLITCISPFCPGENQLQFYRRQVSRLVGSSCKTAWQPARCPWGQQPGPWAARSVPVGRSPVRGQPGSSAGPVASAALSRVLTGEGTARLTCWSCDRAVSLGFHPVAQVTCIPGSAHSQQLVCSFWI